MEEADEDGRGGESSSTNFSVSGCISAIVIVDMKLGITGRFVTIVAAVVVVFGSVGECSWWHDEGDFIVLL